MSCKIVYILSDVHKSVAFEWIVENIDRNRFELIFILLNSSSTDLEGYLQSKNVPVFRIPQKGFKDWPFAIIRTYKLLTRIKPDAIHCHLIGANVIGLIAGKICGIKKRIYTRHHSSLHYISFRKGIFWDKISNKLATHIIAISPIVKQILIDWEKADPRKIVFIPHGFLIDAFSKVPKERIDSFRYRHCIEDRYPIIGVVSRFTKWKGVQNIIPAFERFLKDYPEGVLLMLNAQGDYEKVIFDLLKTIPANSYRVIKFENDIPSAFKSMDVFVHVPIDDHSEAFGQVYVEALAAKTPSVFTLSGIALDFVTDQYNAIVVPYKNSNSIYDGIHKIITESSVRQQLVSNGFESIQKFKLESMINSLETLYVS